MAYSTGHEVLFLKQTSYHNQQHPQHNCNMKNHENKSVREIYHIILVTTKYKHNISVGIYNFSRAIGFWKPMCMKERVIQEKFMSMVKGKEGSLYEEIF